MEHVEGELSAFVAFSSSLAEVAEVAGNAGNAEDAGFLIHERIHFFRRKVVVVHDVEDDSRVDIAAAGAHEDAGERCEAHGRVDAFAIFDGSQGRTVAEVAVDDAQFFNGYAHDFSDFASYIAMARAVEAITADVVFFVEFIREAIHEGFRRHGLMESRIEDADLRNAGHDGFAGVDADDVRRIVERSHSRAFFQGFHDFIRNERGSSEFFAAMDDAVADSVDGIHGFDDAAFSVGEDVEDEFDSDLVIRDGLFDFFLLAIPFVGQLRIGKADFFDQTFCHYFFIVHVDELVLQGRAAAVYNQYDHENLPSFICLRII